MKNNLNNSFYIAENKFGIYPIHVQFYKKFILLQGLSKEFISNKLMSYAELAYSKIYVYKIKITIIEDTDWSVISLPDEMDYFNFHNMVGLLAQWIRKKQSRLYV